jgi:hypothetical protein
VGSRATRETMLDGVARVGFTVNAGVGEDCAVLLRRFGELLCVVAADRCDHAAMLRRLYARVGGWAVLRRGRATGRLGRATILGRA